MLFLSFEKLSKGASIFLFTRMERSLILIKTVLFVFAFLFSLNSHARYLTKNIGEILQILDSDHLVYKGRKKFFGYNSTQSCAYIGQKTIIIENYCYPNRNYPARSLTLVSLDFGIVELYEETNGFDVRRISQSSFAEDVQRVFPKNFKNLTVDELDLLLKTMYDQYTPACWAMKRFRPDPLEQSNCYKVPRADYALWLDSLMDFVLDKNAWDNLYADLKNYF